jgi:hypothetical protein
LSEARRLIDGAQAADLGAHVLRDDENAAIILSCCELEPDIDAVLDRNKILIGCAQALRDEHCPRFCADKGHLVSPLWYFFDQDFPITIDLCDHVSRPPTHWLNIINEKLIMQCIVIYCGHKTYL